MTLYSFLYQLAEIVMPGNANTFFEYLIHTCDDNGGFLRTRYCYSSNVLPDSICDYTVNTALITLESDYDFSPSLDLYSANGHTKVKLQIHFGEYSNDETRYFETLWASSVGFSYALIVDMPKGTFQLSEFQYDKRRHYVIGRPQYSIDDCVRFRESDADCNKNYLDGVIQDVEPFGNREQQEEPSYNIWVQGELYIHIPESSIAFRHRKSSPKPK